MAACFASNNAAFVDDDATWERSEEFITARLELVQPRHDKTNKVTVSPAKTQISLGIHPV